MTEITYYIMDLIYMNVVVGRYIKALIHKKEVFDYISYFFVALRPNAGHDLLILEVSRSHTTTHHSR
jgi:hypothetical protein